MCMVVQLQIIGSFKGGFSPRPADTGRPSPAHCVTSPRARRPAPSSSRRRASAGTAVTAAMTRTGVPDMAFGEETASTASHQVNNAGKVAGTHRQPGWGPRVGARRHPARSSSGTLPASGRSENKFQEATSVMHDFWSDRAARPGRRRCRRPALPVLASTWIWRVPWGSGAPGREMHEGLKAADQRGGPTGQVTPHCGWRLGNPCRVQSVS